MNQPMLDFTAPTARRADPETAHGAAVVAIFNAQTNRAKVLLALVDAGDDGLTDFELARIVGAKQTSAGVRRGELVKLGFVEKLVVACDPTTDAPLGVRRVTRPSDTGTPAQVWCATEAAYSYIAEHTRGDAA